MGAIEKAIAAVIGLFLIKALFFTVKKAVTPRNKTHATEDESHDAGSLFTPEDYG